MTFFKRNNSQFYIVLFLKAFLTSYALLVSFSEPLRVEYYETTIDFLIANIYELLGAYDFSFILVFFISCFFYWYIHSIHAIKDYIRYRVLAVLFSAFLLIGESYYNAADWSLCFGSIVNFIKFVLALCGYSFVFRTGMCLLDQFFNEQIIVSSQHHFFNKHCFLKAFAIIYCSYLPFIILSYPGNLCWDVIGQIEQVILNGGYSTHHPLIHTFFVGGVVQAGYSLFGSYETGLFLYVLLQAAMLAFSLALTITVLASGRVKEWVLFVMLAIYCAAPVYSNIASTAIKDVPFCAFVICYVVCLALYLETPGMLHNKKFASAFVGVQIGVILFRNNGKPLVLLSGIAAFLYVRSKYNFKERIYSLIVCFGSAFLIGQLILMLAAQAVSAAPGSKGEILSIPFQQTARYLQFYKTELDTDEKQAIEAVLGDVSEVATVYNPDISDPVKALYKKDASINEIIHYLKAWFQGLCKHPGVYFEAFFAHVYGWFTPSVSNTIRYEVDYDVINQGGLFPNANKLLIFYYRFTERFTLLGMWNNIGLAVWGLFFLTRFQSLRKRWNLLCTGIPLWVSLLICMASPCFFLHPRYGFPILFALPFLFVFTLLHKDDRKLEKETLC